MFKLSNDLILCDWEETLFKSYFRATSNKTKVFVQIFQSGDLSFQDDVLYNLFQKYKPTTINYSEQLKDSVDHFLVRVFRMKEFL